MTAHRLSDRDLDRAAHELETATPLNILAWAAEAFAPLVTLATSFDPEGCLLIDLIGRHHLPISIFTIDTGLLFAETIELWHTLERRYAITITAAQPLQTVERQSAEHGPTLWQRDPDRCCQLRKVAPLATALAGQSAWITAIRRDQTAERAGAKVIERDVRFGLVKCNPLARWTDAEIANEIAVRGVPTNPLHARGYPSIGCAPCTSPVALGGDPRSGRWRGADKTECGLHASPTPRTTLTPSWLPLARDRETP
jgi:phosphoadenosine phosphosulfate reductase